MHNSLLRYIFLYKKQLLFFFFLSFLCIIAWGSTQGLDPDFGWHLRMGQLILSRGVPKTDPFSYTMPSYPFVDHEWLTNVGIALLFPHIGIFGLSILSSFLAFSALLIQIPWKLKKISIIPLFLCVGALSTYMGIRPQVLSWLFFSILLLMLFHKSWWRILRFFLPLLFLLWVNVHGSFPIGLVVLCLYIGLACLQEKKIHIIDLVISLVCVGVTCITPYGYRMWWEVWMQMSDSSLRWSISEWLPAFFFVNYFFLLLLPISIVFIFITRKRFTLFQGTLYIVLLLFGLSSTRNVPFWLIISFPMTTQAIAYFIKDIASIPFAVERFRKAYGAYFTVIVVVILWVTIPGVFSFDKKLSVDYYPSHAITYLQKNPSSGNVVSLYEWGGYLIWKLPAKKVFIDGRMPSWRRVAAPANESKNAFADYNAIVSGTKKFTPFAKKYHIDTIVITNDSLTKKKTILDTLTKFFHMNQSNFPYLIQQAKNMGFKEVYKDNVAVIYRKN